MAKFQFECLAAESQTAELVAEANAKDWDAAQQLANVRDGVANGLGIAWPGADLIIIALVAWYVLAAAWYIRRLRRQTRPASQLAPQHAR